MNGNNEESTIRGIVIVGLMIGAFAFVVAMFIGPVRETLKDPIASGLFGTMMGFWFKELAQGTAYLFGSTKAANEANSKIADFAITPGAVTADGGATGTVVVNNSVNGDAPDTSAMTADQRSAAQ